MGRVMLWTIVGAVLALSAGPLMAAGGGEGARDGGGSAGSKAQAPNQGGNSGVRTGAPVEQSREVAPSQAERGTTQGNQPGNSEIAHDQGGHGEGWRYKYQNGGWWYWLPSNRWMHYQNGTWQDYTAGNGTYGSSATDDNTAATANAPLDPRYQWYNNQWWYWLPSNRWSYYDQGSWRDAAPGKGPERHETGYRGLLNNSEQHGPNGSEGVSGVHQANQIQQGQGPVNVAPHIDAPKASATPDHNQAGPRK
jgi:hypothetical protein